MKKTTLLILTTLFSIVTALAQDKIIKRDGEEIKSKILEVGTDIIKYKKFDNQDGPTYSIAKSDVFIIKYENGTKDIINVIEPDEDKSIHEYKQLDTNKIRETIEQKKPNFSIGFICSANFSELTIPSGSTICNVKKEVGLYSGFPISFRFSKLLALQSGLFLDLKRFQYKHDDVSPLISIGKPAIASNVLYYITIPILANFRFGNKYKIFFDVGPKISFAGRKNNMFYDYIYISNASNLETDTIIYETRYKSIDVGINLGLGFEVPVSTKINLYFQTDYCKGLLTPFEDYYWKYKINSFYISLGAVYYLNEKF